MEIRWAEREVVSLYMSSVGISVFCWSKDFQVESQNLLVSMEFRCSRRIFVFVVCFQLQFVFSLYFSHDF